MLKIAVLVSGGGTNLQAIFDAIDAGKIHGGEICAVISSRADAYALKRAEARGVKTDVVCRKDFSAAADFDAQLLKELKACHAELIVLAGFLSILGESIIREYPNRIINIHPALIPSFCGAGFYGLRVHESALARGVKLTGATVHFVNEIADGGPIILQKAVAVERGDTPEILQKRVMEQAEWQIMPQAIDLFCRGLLEVKDDKVYIMEENR